MWPFDWFITKKLCSPPPPNPKLEVTHFYIISHECEKPCKVFNLHLHLNGFTQHNMDLHSVFFFFQFFDVKIFVTLPPKSENLVEITLKILNFHSKNKTPTYIVLTYIYMSCITHLHKCRWANKEYLHVHKV